MFSLRLWSAERKQLKESKRIREKYHPLLDAAKKRNDQNAYQSALAEMRFESDDNDGADILRTHIYISRARKLSLPIPVRLDRDHADFDSDENWEENPMNGEVYLTDKGLLEIGRAIRKEEMERLEHTMRWVTRVVLPLIGLFVSLSGLIGTTVGYIAVKHGLK
jgi:hypothetical protein